ncbi:bifunctional RNase H/acid phosphatase [Nocardia asteroides]|uniref:bifunctional RNase H/acid phosphatase n=1 Tax=Nocardia asteroides TaxID=1824 RepID=UPI001E45FEA3|nr:bifunctional RNase H/acid phosphatase [Nocardia asteroides]UGT60608.1 bifunctional RNase H/acid phosphatase [Nocardia asteroides]
MSARPGTVVVEADGGSRGNPGPAGYGAVVFDAERAEVLAERRASIGVATNNVAEYRGLIAGLEAAVELGAARVEVRMDSKLVVEQLSGRWKVKHASMIPLAEEARGLVAKFDAVTFTWIPRAENSHADRLANEAMDAAAGVEVPPLAAGRPASTRAAAASGPRTTSGDQVTAGGRVPGETATAGDRAPGETAAAGDRAPGETATAATARDRAPGWTGAEGAPTRLLLLRHGRTALSVERRYSGRGNPPLDEVGREQAARAAAMLATRGGIDAVVCSPLARAHATATAAADALGLRAEVVDDLIETDFGTWEGLTFTEAATRDPGAHAAWLGDPSLPPPGGESFAAVRTRIERARDDLLARFPERTVLVVSHVTPIKTMLQLALDVGPTLLYRLHLDLAALSIAEFYPDGGASVRLVNDTSYL